jgi:hypothetical protein
VYGFKTLPVNLQNANADHRHIVVLFGPIREPVGGCYA